MPPFPYASLLVVAAATAVGMALLWWRQLHTRNATSVDVAWAAAIGLAGIGIAATSDGAATHRWLAGATAAVWSLRLSSHLLVDRVFSHRGEDARYAALRRRLGGRAAVGFLLVYLAQAVFATAFALPFAVLAQHPDPTMAPVQLLGIAIAIAGLAIETAADRQLAAHRRDPAQRGRTCCRGLWRLSRHPNYFGEWLVWCSIAALAWPAPHGKTALVAPILMFVLIRFVSGVPFAEQQALRSRGDDYRAYAAVTNAFFPWPRPRRGSTP